MTVGSAKVNRTLLEMWIGILALGLCAQIIGVPLVSDQLRYASSLWLGILMALVSAWHMYRSIDRALDYGESGAPKVMWSAYMLRYLVILVVLAGVSVTNLCNPLIVFLGYMSLKVTAYLQPITHKVFEKLFYQKEKGR